MDIEEGTLAVRFARSVIENNTGNVFGRVDLPDTFAEPRGAFVTLRTYPEGHLRGCIGIPYPVIPLCEALTEAAASACHDPRFPVLGRDELAHVTVEVTVLDLPKVLDCPRDELPDNIVVGRDGLIISYRGRRGLLLPQVPEEQGWDVHDYLEGICMKAGLPPGTWREEGAEISVFGGKVFHEMTPYGDISRG